MKSSPAQASFEGFYQDVRGRLLVQTYALTGDLSAAQKAVHDTLVTAWHHWPKVSWLEDPEAWARPQAWARAQRRHTARLWQRDRDVEPEVKDTLDALAKLSTLERRVLLLTHLTALPLDQLAREVGLTQTRTERELQTASAQFALHRAIPSTSIHAVFEPVAASIVGVRWPRTTVLTRAGSSRRRVHTATGVLVAAAALVVSGSLVGHAGDVRPKLGDRAVTVAQEPRASSQAPAPAPPPLTEDALLGADTVGSTITGRWSVDETSNNTQGDGLALPCQQARYSDPEGRAALLRRLSAGTSRVGQLVEASAGANAARAAYDTALGWYAGCSEPRVQLLSTQRVDGVGDTARLLVLRDWDAPGTSMVVGLARTGSLTTTTVSRRPATRKPGLADDTALLADAVRGLCPLPGAGKCATDPTSTGVDPTPVGPDPALLGEVDLPPVSGIEDPWVGTDPQKARVNLAATRCDRADFSGKGVTGAVTRSFVIPGAKRLPPEFGLTETVGSFSTARARAFVGDVRGSLDACPGKDVGTKVARVTDRRQQGTDLTVWHVTVEISDQRSVRYLMAIIRDGSDVAQLGFVPSGDVSMANGAFVDLAERALERLAQLDAP